MKKIAQAIMLLVVTMGLSVSLFGQGSTTAAFNGTVLDKQGAPLPGATVVAIHLPTNTQYGTITRNDGSFDIPGLQPGGPYDVKVSFVGYKGAAQDSLYLRLGENIDLKFHMEEENVQLQEVRVVAKTDNTFNASRTGAKTNVTREQMNELPSISRSLQDYTRLTPQAIVTGGGISIAGTNNRYNNFQIDGTVNNDVFGLSSSGTNGGQAGTQPISLDAIQELQVVIAPYDVRQGGFTGGGINAVTKSGTNKFSGTAYWFGNNQNFVGKTPTSDPNVTRKKLDSYTDNQMGISIGGPIVKDKLFFFANAELAKKDQPSTNNLGDGSSNFSKLLLDSIVNRIAQVAPGYNTGGYDAFTNTIKSTKLFGRVDWNINANNRLTIRHSYVNASSDILSRSADFFRFNNNGYTFLSKTNSTVMELNSRISNNLSNELRVGYTTVRDKRDIMGDPFPFIEIKNIDGASNRTIDLGTERYSAANELDQNILTISDNFNYYYNFLGKHTFTAGTHNEFFHFRNLFIRDNTGAYIYSSMNAFLNDLLPQEYSYSFSNPSTGSTKWAPKFNAYQLGFFAQDEWSVTNSLKFTYGVRIDVPVFPNKPSANTTFNADPNYSQYGVATDQMPKAKVMWSPRIGFNWDVTGDRSTQLRGGAGIFTGRLPFVWLSNQFSNTGNEYVRYDFKGAANFPTGFQFRPDPNNQWVGTSPLSSEIDVVDPHFKFPQSFRANLAVDQKLPYGIKGTLEGIYTKKMNDIMYKDLTKNETGNLAGIDNRPTYTKIAGTPYTNVIYLTNTNKGYSYSITAMLNKDFNFGLSTMAAYTYGKSESVNDGTSSQAYSNWRYNYQYNGSNNPEMSYSAFDVRHRIVASVTYKKEYLNKFATSVGLFYNGQSGANFSYVYNGDINGDGEYYNDLIFVPTDGQIDQMLANGQFVTTTSNTTAPAVQAAELKKFFADEPYLKNRRGEYSQRNGARVPFVHQFDLRIAQDFYLNVAGKKNTLQVTLDIFNLANFLNKDWGRVYSAGYSYSLMQYAGKQAVTNLPLYSFKQLGGNGHAWQIDDFNSRWRAQLGLRYIFN